MSSDFTFVISHRNQTKDAKLFTQIDNEPINANELSSLHWRHLPALTILPLRTHKLRLWPQHFGLGIISMAKTFACVKVCQFGVCVRIHLFTQLWIFSLDALLWICTCIYVEVDRTMFIFRNNLAKKISHVMCGSFATPKTYTEGRLSQTDFSCCLYLSKKIGYIIPVNGSSGRAT